MDDWGLEGWSIFDRSGRGFFLQGKDGDNMIGNVGDRLYSLLVFSPL